jgi:hypothetical protein
VIAHTDLPGLDETTARRILIVARGIAPCLDALAGEARTDAIAIIQGAAAELPKPGERRIRTMTRNGTSVAMDPYESAFGKEERAGLRALCGSAASAAGAPVGVFPTAGVVTEMWPER